MSSTSPNAQQGLGARQGRASPQSSAFQPGENTGCLPMWGTTKEFDKAVREAYAHGERQGIKATERNAYRSGFRWGLLAGLCVACISTAAALNLGMAIGQRWLP